MTWSSICFTARLISVIVLAITYHTNTFVLFFGGIVSLITLELSQLRRRQENPLRSNNTERYLYFIRRINELEHELEEERRYSEQEFVLENELNRKVRIIANLETELNRKVIEIDNLETRLAFCREQIQNAYEKIEKTEAQNYNFINRIINYFNQIGCLEKDKNSKIQELELEIKRNKRLIEENRKLANYKIYPKVYPLGRTTNYEQRQLHL